MELNYFSLYLRDYLRDHRFEPTEISSQLVKDNADRAAQTFEDYRKSGASLDGATDIALQDLFIGIGLSRAEKAADILEEEFSDRIIITEPTVFDFWTQELVSDESIWEDFYKEGELGLNQELIDEGNETLHDRIDQFLTNHGL
ncbi:MAG: DUF1896 domain-containing protein [Lachnospiraceae bacterium]|nr:DUF1896 domain-containing protein [Lachnospiraceae bacterium]